MFSFTTLTQPHVYVIAEAGVNHDGSLEKAFALVDAAIFAQANAVKFQLFNPKALTTASAQKATYQQKNDALASNDESQQAMLERLLLEAEDLQKVRAYAQSKGIDFLCSPFDDASADALVEDFELPFVKLGSGELTNFPLLKRLALKGIPLLLSTGMANLKDVQRTHEFLAPFYGFRFSDAVAFMHCTSQYPAPLETLNLKALRTLQNAFLGHVVGYSDHSLSITEVPATAVGLGAKLYEKHLTLDASSSAGPDHHASLEPDAFKRLVETIRCAELTLGNGIKEAHACERNTSEVARKSLVLKMDLPVGTVLEEVHLTAKRPATGLCASRFYDVLGKRIKYDLKADSILSADALEEAP
ncbi:MAG: N-acetylneuraminate synthase family protein [Vampirovibrionales bacterium]